MNRGILIRPAAIKDLRVIQGLNIRLCEKEKEEFDQHIDLAWTSGEPGTRFFSDRIDKEDGCIFVAISDKQIVGYLAGSLTAAEEYRDIGRIAELDNMFVIEEYRGKGIGTKLYDRFKRWCRSRKVSKIRVQASAGNIGAIRFYQRNGFKDYTLILESDI